MNLTMLAFRVAFDLAELAKVTDDRRERQRAVRTANRAMRTARSLDAMPESSDPDAWDAWRERFHPRRVVVEPDLSALESEIRALRTELATRDAAELRQGTGT